MAQHIKIDDSPTDKVWYSKLVGETIMLKEPLEYANEGAHIIFQVEELSIEQQELLKVAFDIRYGTKLYLSIAYCSFLLTGLPLILKELEQEVNDLH